MRKKSTGILIVVAWLSLGVVLVMAVLVVLNRPGNSKKNTAGELPVTSEPQLAYPAPKSIAAQKVNEQGVYPPSSSKAPSPTQTASIHMGTTSPSAGKGTQAAVNVQRTTVEDAKAAFDKKKAVFLDVRSASLYTRSHIPGAISIPEDEIQARMNELDTNQWIITYCS